MTFSWIYCKIWQISPLEKIVQILEQFPKKPLTNSRIFPIGSSNTPPLRKRDGHQGGSDQAQHVLTVSERKWMTWKLCSCSHCKCKKMDDMKVMFVFMKVMLAMIRFIWIWNESYHYKMVFGLCAWTQT